MKLTESNFRLYAAKSYDNPFCLTEAEFESDLFKASMIKKLITNYLSLGKDNTRLLVNTVISFFNVFEHHAATEILRFKLFDHQVEYANSVLLFLSLPMIGSQAFNSEFLIEVRNVYSESN